MIKLNLVCLLLVSVLIETHGFSQSLGTGFLVSEDGLVATSNHVIQDATSIEVDFNGHKYLASKVAKDEANDLAIIRIDGEFPYLEIKGSEETMIGEEIFTVGFPNPELQGYEPKMTAGVISSMSGVQDDPTCYQISVPVQPGNSGGPLMAKNGDVLGIIKAKLGARAGLVTSGALPENVNYAVKSDYLNLLIKMAKPRTKSDDKRKTKNSARDLPGVEKAIACIVLVKADNEKYRGEPAGAGKTVAATQKGKYEWEKQYEALKEIIDKNKTLEKFDMDDPLETYDSIGSDLKANNELGQKQIEFFENWKANTVGGSFAAGIPIMYIRSGPFEEEWEVVKKRFVDYTKNKEMLFSQLDKYTYMMLIRPKITAKGLRLCAEAYEEQWNDISKESDEMRTVIRNNALQGIKSGAIFPESKIIISDTIGYVYTDPTINDDSVVEATTKKRIQLFSASKDKFIIKEDEERALCLAVSSVSNEPFIISFPKKYRSEVSIPSQIIGR